MSDITPPDGLDGNGIISDIVDALKGDVPAYVTDTLGTILVAVPSVMIALAGIETDPLIALPYLEDLLELGVAAFKDYAGKSKTPAECKKCLDDAIGDLLEDLKFGAKGT